MDQLLVVAGHAGDRLVTREALSARHQEALAAAGIEVDVVSLRAAAGARCPVEQQLLDRPRPARPRRRPGDDQPLRRAPRHRAPGRAAGCRRYAPDRGGHRPREQQDLVERPGAPARPARGGHRRALRRRPARRGRSAWAPPARWSRTPSGWPGGARWSWRPRRPDTEGPAPRLPGTEGPAPPTGRALDAVVRHLDRQAARGRRVELVVQPALRPCSGPVGAPRHRRPTAGSPGGAGSWPATRARLRRVRPRTAG